MAAGKNTSGAALNTRVAHLETSVEALQSGLTAVRTELADGQKIIFGKLDQLAAAVVGVQSQRPLSIGQVLGFVKDVAYLFALVVAGIVYVSGNINAPALSRIETRLQYLEAQRQPPAVAPSAYRDRNL